MSFRLRFLLGLLSVTALLAGSVQAAERTVESLMEGPSVNIVQGKLNAGDYLPVTTFKLKDAPVLWVDFDYLREKGIRVPREGLTPEFRATLSNALGWSIPVRGDSPDAFTALTKVLLSDFYGGPSIGLNVGSGRAAEGGELQLKYLGQTPMVFESGKRGHANGIDVLADGILESIWSKLMNGELPGGASRNIALLERKTDFKWEGKWPEKLSLLARVIANRPAQYFPIRKNERFPRNPKSGEEFARQIAQALPVPAEAQGLPLAERIGLGLRNLARIIGEQYGTAFVNRVEHGSAGASNIEMCGRFLDWGTITAQPSYAKIRCLPWTDYSGEREVTRKRLVRDLRRIIGWRVTPEIAAKLPSLDSLGGIFDEAYEYRVRRGFLAQTGVPLETIDRLEARTEVRELGNLLWQAATEGARKLTFTDHDELPKGLTRYELDPIFRKVAERKVTDAARIESFLPKKMPAPQRQRLAELYAGFLREAETQAARDGIGRTAFWTLARENSRIWTTPRPELYYWKFRNAIQRIVEEYKRTGDPTVVERGIDEAVARNQLWIPSGETYKTVLSQSRNAAQDSAYRKVYDARLGEYRYEADLALADGKVWLVAGQLPADRPEELQVSVRDPRTRTRRPVRTEVRDGRLRFSWPASLSEGGATELTVRDPATGNERSLRVEGIHSLGVPEIPSEACAGFRALAAARGRRR